MMKLFLLVFVLALVPVRPFDGSDYDESDDMSAKAISWGYYIPEDGVFFCPVAKSACAEWKRFMRWMAGLSEWEVGPFHSYKQQRGIPLLGFDYSEKEGWKYAQDYDVEVVMSDKAVLKLMAVRAPEDRLLSGFMQKCMHFETYKNCPYLELFPSLWDGKPPTYPTYETFKHFSASMGWCLSAKPEHVSEECLGLYSEFVHGLSLSMSKMGPCYINVHFRPHYCFCQAWERREEYTFLPFADMADAADKSLELAQKMSSERKREVRAFLHERMDVPHDTQGKITNSQRLKDRFYEDKSLLERVHTMYARDYELLGSTPS